MAMTGLNKRLVSLAKWMLPPSCIVCAGRAAHRDLCHDCAVTLPWNLTCCARCALPLGVAATACGACATEPPPWTRAVAPLTYEFPVDSLLRQLKFSRRLAHAHVLGQLLAEWIACHDISRPDLLIPVPLHWRRLLRRQFNQAEEIALPVARQLSIAMNAGIVRRHRHTPQQSGLTASQRRHNLRNAFVVNGDISQAHVALIDDVMTTGSTMTGVTEVLLRAGATRVDVWTVARVATPA